MEPYAQIPDASPFAASVNVFTALVTELEGGGAAGLTACELEDLLAERGRDVQRQLLQDHLDLRAVREEQAVRCRPAVRPVPWPGWPRWKPSAARSRPRTRRSPAAAAL